MQPQKKLIYQIKWLQVPVPDRQRLNGVIEAVVKKTALFEATNYDLTFALRKQERSSSRLDGREKNNEDATQRKQENGKKTTASV